MGFIKKRTEGICVCVRERRGQEVGGGWAESLRDWLLVCRKLFFRHEFLRFSIIAYSYSHYISISKCKLLSTCNFKPVQYDIRDFIKRERERRIKKQH